MSRKEGANIYVYEWYLAPEKLIVQDIRQYKQRKVISIQMKFNILGQRQPAQARSTKQAHKHGLQHLHPSTRRDDSSNCWKDRSPDLAKNEDKC